MDFLSLDLLIKALEGLDFGKEDIKDFKLELEQLLNHSTQSVITMFCIYQQIDLIKEEDLTLESFKEISTELDKLFLGSGITFAVTTHCSNIKNDLARIDFKAKILLRTGIEFLNKINKSFEALISGDDIFISEFYQFSHFLQENFYKITQNLENDEKQNAINKIKQLKSEMKENIDKLDKIIKLMHEKENQLRTNLY
jgi:hypothetical protein